MANRVFSFSGQGAAVPPAEEKKEKVVTYTVFDSDSAKADESHPILVLEDTAGICGSRVTGIFSAPGDRTGTPQAAMR